MAEKNYCWAMRQLPSERYMPAYRVYMPIRVHRPLKITEFIQNNPLAKGRKLHSTWCTNEKTAMEAALGMSTQENVLWYV